MRVRPMSGADLDAVLGIEHLSFSPPWKREWFEEALKSPLAILKVAEDGGEVAGYLMASWEKGCCHNKTIHLVNLAVHPEKRRQGVARLMMDDLMRDENEHATLFLEVRESNTAAQQLYLTLGFSVTGLKTGYYEEDGENAVVMARFPNNSDLTL